MRSTTTLGNKVWWGTGAVLAGVAGLVASCGGGSDAPTLGGSGLPATIDTAGVDSALADVSAFVAVCQGTGGLSADAAPMVTSALRLLALPRMVRLGQVPSMRVQALTSTQPADMLGDCGGRYGYTSYSHVNGVTTATMAFSGYCSTDSDTGNQNVVDGSVAFVNTATPTDSGPISTHWVGSSDGLTTLVKSSAGATVSSQTLSFSDMAYTVGVPGGAPTAANPDTLAAQTLRLRNNTTTKTYEQSNYRLTMFDTTEGGQQTSLSGRGYRSSGDYFDISTTTPMVTNASGDYTQGTMTFTGANGSNAVATLVPGSLMQARLSVNGTPVTSVPACK